jgi:DNA-binding NarL/FixJ family response regulator
LDRSPGENDSLVGPGASLQGVTTFTYLPKLPVIVSLGGEKCGLSSHERSVLTAGPVRCSRLRKFGVLPTPFEVESEASGVSKGAARPSFGIDNRANGNVDNFAVSGQSRGGKPVKSDDKCSAPGDRIRILVSDTTRMGTQLILEALRQDDRFNVVGVLAAPKEFAAAVSDFKPNTAIIGIAATVDARKGFDLLRHAQARCPELQTVMLLDSSTREWVVEAFRAGARGILCRDDGLDALRECIYAVHLGQVWATSDQVGFVLEVFSRRWVPQAIVDKKGRGLLSRRELDVVRCVSEGMTNREVASHLHLSEHTVKNYIFRIFDKLGVSNRAELILYALNHSCTPESGHLPHWCEHCATGCRIESPVSPSDLRQQRCRKAERVDPETATVSRTRQVQ